MKQWPHNYSTVQEWEAKRTVELSRIYSPYVRVTDAYADLVCEIVDVIGKKKPKSVQGVVVRDLLGDIFDALYEARRVILTGKCSIAYPLGRRVFESVSLMALCILDEKCAAKWHSGAEIPNSEVRRKLGAHPLGEDEKSMKDLYRFFSGGAHPNRDLIPRRFLGEGNEFTLGAVPKPSMALVTEYCMIHLRHFYCDLVDPASPDFGKRYLHVADAAQKLQAQLETNFERLAKEERAMYASDKGK